MAKKTRKKNTHRLYAFVVLSFGIAIIALSVFLLFRIRKIQVTGNDYLTDTQLVQMVKDDRYSANSLFLMAKYKLGQGEVYPCLESVHISMKSPWSIQITVKEKPMVGYMKKGKEYLFFDREGLIVKKDTKNMEGLPLVKGIHADNTELYETVKNNNGFFEEILECSEELQKYQMTAKTIEYRNDHIYLYVKNVCINLGNSVTAEKIAQIPPIMEKLGKKKGTLHLENYSEDQATITFNKGKYPE